MGLFFCRWIAQVAESAVLTGISEKVNFLFFDDPGGERRRSEAGRETSEARSRRARRWLLKFLVNSLFVTLANEDGPLKQIPFIGRIIACVSNRGRTSRDVSVENDDAPDPQHGYSP